MSIIHHSPGPQTTFGRGPHWLHESPFLPPLWETTQDVGAPSLKHSAMKCILSDQSLLKREHFAHVPWPLAKYLWECLGKCQKQTMHMWKIMADTYPQQFHKTSPEYCLRIDSPKEPVKCYIDLLNSDIGSWQAMLAISSTHATTADLVAIGNLKNLVAMDIYPTNRIPKPEDIDEGRGQGLDDRILRTWLEVAETTGSLQQLRFLRLVNQPRVTIQALELLAKLPNLQHVALMGCSTFQKIVHSDRDHFGEWLASRSLPYPQPLPEDESKSCLVMKGSRLPWKSRIVKKHNLEENIDGVQGLPALNSDTPILEFDLSPTPLLTRETILHLTRSPQQNQKKRRVPQPDSSKSQGKRVMKDRPGRDIADVLGDFL
ncbi:hypothetical protein N7448_003731 [Penicillium atrosanguineum]|uniref:Uncharacterized protein n=1 Tax=Penicillium atrosanguineum TaxID=1132637 RepID=A0A9W9U670_9EURO|nr:hypothetical protein N7526_009534 [Penicillium atrosanguineum]KAJ5140323.1 hypothetical protein N7448_003731 [Penicillium atrosanguineum]KAJ5315755.1 hypothetical protein N7476_006062 [Penicillium atrosanguineum]